MGAFAQLRLLLWKNLLQQIRSPVFTVFEFCVPFLLIGLSFGLMIGLRGQFESSHGVTDYQPFSVMGSAYDVITPTNLSDPKSTMLDTSMILSGKAPECQFLNFTNLGNGRFRLGVDFAYAPNTPEMNQLMGRVKDRYNVPNLVTEEMKMFFKLALNITLNEIVSVSQIHGYPTEDEMVDFMKTSFESQCGNPLLAGIVFGDEMVKNFKGAQNYTYAIRLSNTNRRLKSFGDSYGPWNVKEKFAVQYVAGPINPSNTEGGYPGYWKEGFLTTQKAIDVALKDLLSEPQTVTPVNMTDLLIGRYPFPPYQNKIIEIAAFFVPMIIVFSFFSSIIYIVRGIVMEKEDRLKEYMRVMGLAQWVHWVAHFILNYSKLVVTVVVLTILMSVITPKSDWSVLFVVFLLYAFNACYFAFFISTLMQSGTAGTMLATFGWLILYFWQALFSNFDLNSPFPFAVQLVNCLNPDIALNYAVLLAAQYETQSDGLKWSEFFTSASPDQQLCIGHTILFLIGDGLILVLLTWYTEAVYPGGEGVPQKPWFFVLPSYWFPESAAKKKTVAEQEEKLMNGKADWQNYAKLEADPNDRTATVNVVGLSKTYGTSFFKKLFDCNFGKDSEKKALDHLNLKLYHGQITALLGHNGAGKSTTFSLLTGVGAPSSGTAYIDDYDIRSSLPAIRKKMGLCPQYNTLFNSLTVMEHLEFFCKLKGRPWDPKEAMDMITRLKIEFKAHARAGSLSGGQKRKLSLAIALIGGSEIVMLDEPTSGMDPGARHETWTLLQDEKANRTMLLTTHFMEEADVLADRIAILAHGQLQCCGSGMFLKGEYGAGYHLVVVYSERPDVEATMSIIKKYASDAQLASIIGQEGTFLLDARHRPKFPALFKEIEMNQEALKITSFGVSITTMEEVFLKVGEEADDRYNKDKDEEDQAVHMELQENDPILQKLRCPERLTGFALQWQHWKAMFIKRAIFFSRKWALFIPTLVFPIAYLAMMMSTAKTIPTAKEQPPLYLTFDQFVTSDGDGYITSDGTLFNGTLLTNQINQSLGLMKAPAGMHVQQTSDVTAYILNQTLAKGTRTFGLHYPLAFSALDSIVGFPMIRAFFNNFAYASSPLSIVVADSVSLSSAIGRKIFLTVINHPLPPTSQDTLKNGNLSNTTASIVAYAMITVMALIVAGNVAFIIREKKKKSKHMQLLSGLRPWMFWLTTFVWDMAWFLIRVACIIAIFFAFGIEQYTSSAGTVFTLVLCMTLYAWAAIPQTYWLSFRFNSAPKGYSLLVLFHILTGMAGVIAVPIIQQTASQNGAYAFSIVWSFFFPTYNLCNIFIQVYNNEFGKEACGRIDCKKMLFQADFCCGPKDKLVYTNNILGDPGQKGILWPIIFFSIQGFLYWILVILKELEYPTLFDLVKRLFKRGDKVGSAKGENWSMGEEAEASIEDSDVLNEKSAVAHMDASSSAIVVKDIQKWYGKFNAVKGVSFHVNKGDCFGLLGVNGAGKTSTFQMVTGENSISAGDAHVLGWSVTHNWRQAGAQLGYCPQFDAIIKEMTGEETLYMFARIRGLPPSEIPGNVAAVIHAIGIGMYAKRQAKTYSGGNKRRLSLGIALVGLPDVLLLDEPTTGVDPKARRVIWNILARIRELGSAMVLTSHSMDECEALCTELAVMVYGRFRCYGSCQHIKSRYGAGYTLLIRMKDVADTERTKKEIYSKFPNAKLKEQHVLQLNFELPRSDDVTWSSLFEQIENISQTIGFDDYSLSQTTLEQVFLEFSRAASVSPTDTF